MNNVEEYLRQAVRRRRNMNKTGKSSLIMWSAFGYTVTALVILVLLLTFQINL